MECVSGAVACLAPGSVGASIPVGSGPAVGVTPESARAQRFAEMLQAEPQRESVYVAAADVAPSSNNALKSLATQFQALELPTGLPPSVGLHASAASYAPTGSHASAGQYEQGSVDSELDPLYAMQDASRQLSIEMLQFQAQVVRTSMMMDVMSTAKQGVTTLFQQQG